MDEIYRLEFQEKIVHHEDNPNTPKGSGKDDLADLRSNFMKNVLRKKGTIHTSDLGDFVINNHSNYVKFISKKFLSSVEETFRIADAKSDGREDIPNYKNIDDFLHCDLNESQWSVEMSNREQLNRVYQVFYDFLTTMNEVIAEINNENESTLATGKINEKDLWGQYFYSYSAPLYKL